MRSVVRRPLLVILLLTLGTFSASPAQASIPEDSVDLTWEAPPGCPMAHEVRAEMVDAMGSVAAERHIRATAQVSREGGDAWVASLVTEVDGRSQRRALRAPSCAELAAAVATVLALEISGDAKEAREPPAPSASPAPAPAPARLPLFAAGANGAIGVGASGDPSLGLGGQISWLPGRSRVEIGAIYFAPAHVERSGLGIGGDFDLLVGSVTGCHAVLGGEALRLSPCLGAEIGRHGASGKGAAVETAEDGASLWVAGRAGALGTWQLGRFVLRMQLDAVVPLVRNRYLIESVGEVYRPAAVSGRAMVGGEVHFP